MDYGAALEMRFGATRRGFESRPLRHAPARLVAVAFAALTLLAGCALDSATSSAPPSGAAEPFNSFPAAPSSAPSLSAEGRRALAREAAAAAFADELGALDPADRATVLDEFADAVGSRLDGLPPTAAAAELRRIVAIGTFRLDDAMLLRRLELETKATLGLDVPTCAAVARGEPAENILDALTPAERMERVRITVAAAAAEVSPMREPRQLSREESTAVVTAVAKAASRADAARIHDLATRAAKGTALSDDDACWLMRVPYRAEAALTPADRLLLSRYVLGSITG